MCDECRSCTHGGVSGLSDDRVKEWVMKTKMCLVQLYIKTVLSILKKLDFVSNFS